MVRIGLTSAPGKEYGGNTCKHTNNKDVPLKVGVSLSGCVTRGGCVTRVGVSLGVGVSLKVGVSQD